MSDTRKTTDTTKGAGAPSGEMDNGDSSTIKSLEHQVQQAILSNKNQTRSDQFLDSLPAKFIYYDLKDLQDFSLSIKTDTGTEEISIKKIRLLEEEEEESKKSSTQSNRQEAVLYIAAHDGRRFMFGLQGSDVEPLRKQMQACSANTVNMFSRKSSIAIDWEKETMSDVYDRNSKKDQDRYKYYEDLHADIQKQILSIIKEKSLNEITIIDGGCGTGLFLKELERKFDQGIELHLIGFDFNQGNINQANDNYSGSIHYTTGDLTKTDDFITQCKNNNWIAKNASDDTVLVLSGSLTRLVLKNSFQALRALHSIANSDQIDYIVGGGVGEPLLNDHIAKKIGFLNVPTSDNKKNLFAYQKRPFSEIIETKLNKLKRDNILDLALCPSIHAEKLITELADKVKDDTVIDLSFAQLSDKLISQIQELVEKNPQIKLACWHNKESELNKLTKITTQYGCPFSFSLVKDESYLMASRQFFFHLHPTWHDEIHATKGKGLLFPPTSFFHRKLTEENIITKETIKQLQSSSGNFSFGTDLINKYLLRLSEVSDQRELKEKMSKTVLALTDQKLQWLQEPDENRGIKTYWVLNSEKGNVHNIVLKLFNDLENEVWANGNLGALALLIHFRQQGIEILSGDIASYSSGRNGRDLVEEIKLYQKLKDRLPKQFSEEFVDALCDRRIKEFQLLDKNIYNYESNKEIAEKARNLLSKPSSSHGLSHK